MENTRENDKKWIETLQERNRVLNELLQLTQIENEELKEQLIIPRVVVNEAISMDGVAIEDIPDPIWEEYIKGEEKSEVELCDNPHCDEGVVDRDYYGNPIYCQVCDKHN